MAVDTRNKRASVLGLTLAALVVLPAPNGSVSAPDRLQVSANYAGIAADSPIPSVVTPTGAISADGVENYIGGSATISALAGSVDMGTLGGSISGSVIGGSIS
jgi:hypothetical protein